MKSRHFPKIAVYLVLLGIPGLAFGQSSQPASAPIAKKRLTYDLLYGAGPQPDYGRRWIQTPTWLPDGAHYLQSKDGESQQIRTADGETVASEERETLEKALIAQGDFDADAAKRTARNPGIRTKDRTKTLIHHNDALYLYDAAAKAVSKAGPHSVAELLSLSPKATRAAFVRDNNVFVIDLRTGETTKLTSDGSPTLLNGKLDWVYQEEVYGRGDWQAYWWSDDDQYLAYLQLDESKVPSFTIVDHLPVRSGSEQTNYPKSGDPNPTVKLGMVPASGGETVWVDLSKYANDQPLVVRVGWSPDGKVIFQVQDREQIWLDLNEADPQTGQMHTLFRETTPAWVDVLGEPKWLPDGSFLWQSARSGYRHVYHYARDGTLIRPVTQGDWQMTDLHGVDPAGEWVYFEGLKDSPIEQNVYRVKLADGEPQRLTTPGSSHSASFDPMFQFFFDRFSNVSTPTRLHLRKANGELVRVISEAEAPALTEYEWSTPEFVRFKARDGWLLNGVLVKPTPIEPGRKYPIYVTTYAGPGAPTVRNSWGAAEGTYGQLLAQEGIAVWCVDPRSASNESAKGTWACYKQLGVSELQDIEDSLDYLGDNYPYLDTTRVGIHGFSYGGFMAAFALTHSDRFAVGIAGAPVTDWRNYDTIYTERYMLTPQNNPAGYDATSAVKGAKNLHGKLLLVHGLMDDNVHLQNTVQMMDELQAAEKDFEVMLYPQSRHGIGRNSKHWLRLRYDFLREGLGVKSSSLESNAGEPGVIR